MKSPRRLLVTTARPLYLMLMLAVVLGVAIGSEQQRPAQSGDDTWAPLRPLVGSWKGKGKTPAGEAVQKSEWKFVLGGKYLQGNSSSEAAGDHHQDMGVISYDKARRRFVYRSFHSEGFVNRYVGEISADGSRIVFTSEAIENGPPGLRAREIFEFKDGRLATALELASGDGEFKPCASGNLERVSAGKAAR